MLKNLNEKICPNNDNCNRIGKSKNYLVAAVLAVILDIAMPIAYFVAVFFVTGWLLIFVEVALITVGVILWILLFREIGFHSLLPVIGKVIGIILMVTILLLLVGLLLFVLPWFIIAVVWHWWEYGRN